MPYKQIWVPPDIFLDYRGVKVYRVYKDDDLDYPPRNYWYGLSPYCSDYDNFFDVRDVATAMGLSIPNHPYSADRVAAVLRTAIDTAMAGNPELCGPAFAACWESRVSEEFDPLDPVTELMPPELRDAVSTVLNFCQAASEMGLDAELFERMGITDDEFNRALELLRRLRGQVPDSASGEDEMYD